MTNPSANTKLGALLAELRAKIVSAGHTRPAADLLRDLQKERGER